jgi:exodeoxyribonuclease VII large subunit
VPGPLALARAQLGSQSDRLRALDPRAVLSRGFVWVEDEEHRPVVSVRRLQTDMPVRAVWSDGAATARIEAVEPGADGGPSPV